MPATDINYSDTY